MRFEQYISEKTRYSMSLSVLKKVFKSQFDVIKSPGALDQLYDDFNKQIENWSGYNDDEYEWIDMMFRTTAKRLHIDKKYGSLKKPQ